jgi:hypothetical protein
MTSAILTIEQVGQSVPNLLGMGLPNGLRTDGGDTLVSNSQVRLASAVVNSGEFGCLPPHVNTKRRLHPASSSCVVSSDGR